MTKHILKTKTNTLLILFVFIIVNSGASFFYGLNGELHFDNLPLFADYLAINKLAFPNSDRQTSN